jgi:hypothetical protein
MKFFLSLFIVFSINVFSQTTYEIKTETLGPNYNAYTGQGKTISTSTVTLKKDPNKEMNEMTKNVGNNLAKAINNGAFKTASQKCEDIVAIPLNINKYKYLTISKVSSSKEKEIIDITKVIYEELKGTNWILLDSNSILPEDLKINPNLSLFLYLNSENVGWPFRIVGLTITDYKGNIIHQRAVRHDRSATFLAELTLKSIKTFPYSFNSDLVDKQLLSDEDSKKLTKEEALIKLKEAKELLDLKVISNDEYELLINKLKPILINNN